MDNLMIHDVKQIIVSKQKRRTTKNTEDYYVIDINIIKDNGDRFEITVFGKDAKTIQVFK